MTEKQLEVYEKELKLYKQRLAFVEKVEQIEGADIKKYKPTFRAIGAISSHDLAPYENKGVGKVELRKAAIETPSAKLFAARSISSADITDFKNATDSIRNRTALGSELGSALSRKAAAGDIGARKISISKAAINTFKERHFESSVQMQKVSLNKKPIAGFESRSFAAPELMPVAMKKTAVTAMAAREFRNPQFTAALKKNTVAGFETRAFAAPEIKSVELKKTVVSAMGTREFKAPQFTAALKKNTVAGFEARAFAAPEIKSVELKKTAVSAMGAREFKAPQFTAALKKNTVAGFEARAFAAPEIRSVELKKTVVPTMGARDFKAPQYAARVMVPGKAEVPSTEFRLSANNAARVSRPDVKGYMGKNFNMPSLSRPEIKAAAAAAPEIKRFDAPKVDVPERSALTMPSLKLVDFHRQEIKAKVNRTELPEIKKLDFGMPEIKAPVLTKSERQKIRSRRFSQPDMPEIRLSVNVSPEKPEFRVGNMPEVRAEIRKPDIISGSELDFSKLNFMAAPKKSRQTVTQEEVAAKTERIKALDTMSICDNILSAFNNDIKGTEV